MAQTANTLGAEGILLDTAEIVKITYRGTGNVMTLNGDAILIPVGDNTTKPTAPESGMIRYNTSNNAFEGYIINGWAPFAANVNIGSYLANSNVTLQGSLVVAGNLRVTSNATFETDVRSNTGNGYFTSGRVFTNTLSSSDSNVSIKLDAVTNKRHIFSAYGFDFKDDNGILTPVNYGTRTVITYTGSDQSFVVPTGITKIFTKLWGAGGGGGSYGGWRQGSLGGAGGYSMGILQVVPGETCNIRIGQGGSARANSITSYPDGGAPATSTSDNRYCASGGGSSSINVPSRGWVLVAGGGGGGGAVNGYDLNSGGAGGGTVGHIGNITLYNRNESNGRGGTQSAGGDGGTANYTNGQAGAAFLGGTHQFGSPYGGGGGGGWYGGGSGCYSSAYGSMGGGGGGSGYVHSSVLMGQTYTGSSFTPPFFQDPDLSTDNTYQYARGGDEAGQGGHGLAILYY